MTFSIFPKTSILDVWKRPEYTSVTDYSKWIFRVESHVMKLEFLLFNKKFPRLFNQITLDCSLWIQVPVHCDSLNHGDVFILDNGSRIWVWCGSESNRGERRKVCTDIVLGRSSLRAFWTLLYFHCQLNKRKPYPYF